MTYIVLKVPLNSNQPTPGQSPLSLHFSTFPLSALFINIFTFTFPLFYLLYIYFLVFPSLPFYQNSLSPFPGGMSLEATKP